MNPVFAFLIVCTVKTSLVAAFGCLIQLAGQNRSARWRNNMCRLSLVAVLLVPLWMAVGERLALQTDLPGLEAPSMVRIAPTPLPYLDSRFTYVPGTVHPEVPSVPTDNLGLFAACAYGFVVIFIVCRLVFNLRAVGRQIQCAQPLDSDSLPLRCASVRSIDGLSSPAVFGLRRPTIVVPNAAEGWPKERMEAALRHEWSHIQRHDWAWQIASQVLVALHWANPFVRGLASALRSSAELAADGAVLRAGAEAKEYARELLAIAALTDSSPAVVAMARPQGIRMRVRHILENRASLDLPRPFFRMSATLAVAASAVAAGMAIEHGLIPNSKIASFGPGKPFYGPFRLSDGDQISLEFVQSWAVHPNEVWLPDGRPAPSSIRHEALDFPAAADPPDRPHLHFRFVKTGRQYAKTWIVQTPFPTNYAGYGGYGFGGDGPALAMATVILPTKVDQIDLRLGFSDAPWHSYGSFSLGDSTLHATLCEPTWEGWWNGGCASYGPLLGDTAPDYREQMGPNSVSQRKGSKDAVVAVTAPAQSPDDIAIEFTVPPSLLHKDLFLKAYATDEKAERELLVLRHQVNCSGTGHFPGDRCRYIYLNNVGRVTRVELMVRDIDWMTFKGIHTHPDR